MAFKNYKSIGLILVQYGIRLDEETSFYPELRKINASQQLKDEIAFNISEFPYDESEAGICEWVISPILREAYKPFSKKLALWVQKPIKFDKNLGGTPDYLFAKKSALGRVVFDKPYLAVVEAKKDDFTGGWGQCLAEMYAIQQLNQEEFQPTFGIVTNGQIWEFGKLEQKTFTQYLKNFQIENLDELLSAINGILEECIKNIDKQ